MEEIDPRYYKKEEDPKLFVSQKTKRGPLAKDWQKTQKPLMCIYKLTYVEFKVWGLQTTAESWIQKSMVHDVLTLGHKQAFCWLDEWYDMTIDDLRKFEQETKEFLDQLVKGVTPTGTPKTSSDKKIEEDVAQLQITEQREQIEDKQEAD